MPSGLVMCLLAVPLDPDLTVLLPLTWHLLSRSTGHLSLGLGLQPPLPGSRPKPRPHFSLTSLNREMSAHRATVLTTGPRLGSLSTTSPQGSTQPHLFYGSFSLS